MDREVTDVQLIPGADQYREKAVFFNLENAAFSLINRCYMTGPLRGTT